MEKISNIVTAKYEKFFYTSGEYNKDHPMLYHRHKDFYELIYVSEGAGSYRVGNRIYDLKPGNMAVVDKNVWHGFEPFLNENMVTYTCAVKDIRLNDKKVETMIEKNRRSVIEFDPGGTMEKLMLALFELQSHAKPDTYICDSLCSVILKLVYYAVSDMKEKEEKTDHKNDELVRSITSYLDENYAEEINLVELGNMFGVSHFYLAHIFKEETGISPMKYVMHRKIGEAQNLLMNTNMNIQDIGDSLGFSSSSHLSAVFKKYFGISPKTYRQNFKEPFKRA